MHTVHPAAPFAVVKMFTPTLMKSSVSKVSYSEMSEAILLSVRYVG